MSAKHPAAHTSWRSVYDDVLAGSVGGPMRILGSDAAVAVGRFHSAGVKGYRARSGGPLRPTRAEAEADELGHLEKETM